MSATTKTIGIVISSHLLSRRAVEFLEIYRNDQEALDEAGGPCHEGQGHIQL